MLRQRRSEKSSARTRSDAAADPPAASSQEVARIGVKRFMIRLLLNVYSTTLKISRNPESTSGTILAYAAFHAGSAVIARVLFSTSDSDPNDNSRTSV